MVTTERPDGRIGVVTLCDRLSHGGAERLAAELAMRLDPDRFESTLCISRLVHPAAVFSGDLPRKLQAEIESKGVRFIGMSRGRPWDLRPWAPLVRLLRSGSVQVIHGHMLGSNTWAVTLGRLTGIPVIVTHEHTWEFSGQPVRRLIDRYIVAARSNMLIAVSEQDRQRMIEFERIPEHAVTYIPNGIEGRAPSGHDVRSELGIAPDAPLVVSVGMMRTQKRFDYLVEATALLVRRVPNARVLIVGDGPERPSLEALAAELGLGDALLMPGSRTDIPDILAAADVAAVSSDFEGSPLSVMEYMEAGLPVVATDVGGLASMVHHGEHGLLVPAGEPAALAEAVASLLADPRRGAAMGAAARERRRAEYDLTVMVARVEALYEELLADARLRRS
jgi:glycosyltransferase involved in cell wall biosynthesis